MVSLREEQMAHFFTKFHLEGLPRAAVLHRFTEADGGFPHSHPFAFTSFIIVGGYQEEVFDAKTGFVSRVSRNPGVSFRNEYNHIHRITKLLDGECWTLILPEEWKQTPGFWDFREDGSWYRDWNGEWALVHPKEGV